MPVTQEEREGIQCFTITNSNGVKLGCISLGATITEVKLQDGADVVLGFRDVQDYSTDPWYIGTSVGRVANRIRDAKFSLDGTTYHLSPNASPHTLHGGETGFNKANWTVLAVGENSVTFKHVSPDGDMGYPGTLEATVTYTLSENNEVTIVYQATSDSPTIVNLVNHTYFNLASTGTICDHTLLMSAETYTPLDKELIAIGSVESVKGTPLDFTTPTAIGLRMEEVGGYDINYNVKDSKKFHHQDSTLHHCATLQDPASGHELTVYSDQPGVQLYTGNFLDGSITGKNGEPIIQYGGVCLETQAWPNAANNPAADSQVILKPGQTYRSKTLWAFR